MADKENAAPDDDAASDEDDAEPPRATQRKAKSSSTKKRKSVVWRPRKALKDCDDDDEARCSAGHRPRARLGSAHAGRAC